MQRQKLEEKAFLRKMSSGFQGSYTKNYKRYIAFRRKIKGGKRGKKGGKTEETKLTKKVLMHPKCV